MPEKPAEGANPEEGKSSEVVVVEVDGEQRSFKAEDVSNLLAQQASATQKAQKVAVVTDAAKKYGLDPDAYVGHAENAFATATKLMELGIIDNEGNIIKTEEKVPAKDSPISTTPTSPKVDDSKLDIVEAALVKIDQRMTGLENDQTRLMRVNVEKEVLSKYETLNKEDVSKVLSTAMKDQSKSIMQHAADAAEAKAAGATSDRARYAKEFGVDLEVFDANKIREQDADGGTNTVISGKKLSFRKVRGENANNVISPLQATREYFKKIDSGG